MGALSPWHWAIILVVLVVLFGSKKLPDAARGLGRSLRIFKSEVKEMQNDGKDTSASSQSSSVQSPQLPASEPVRTESVQPNSAQQDSVRQDPQSRSA